MMFVALPLLIVLIVFGILGFALTVFGLLIVVWLSGAPEENRGAKQ